MLRVVRQELAHPAALRGGEARPALEGGVGLDELAIPGPAIRVEAQLDDAEADLVVRRRTPQVGGLRDRLGLPLPEAREVELAAEEEQQFAVRTEHGADVQLVDEGAAVAPVVQQLHHDVASRGDGGPDAGDVGRVGRRPLKEAAIAPDQLLRRVAGEFQEGAVGEDDRIVGQVRIGDDHRHPGLVGGGEQEVGPGGPDTGQARGRDGRELGRAQARVLLHQRALAPTQPLDLPRRSSMLMVRSYPEPLPGPTATRTRMRGGGVTSGPDRSVRRRAAFGGHDLGEGPCGHPDPGAGLGKGAFGVAEA